MNKSKLAILAGILVFFALISAGCKGSSPPSSKRTGKPANVSKEEYKRIEAAVKLDAVSIAPNSVGFMIFYGDVSNGSDRYVRKVHIVAERIVEEKGRVIPAGVMGRGVAEDLAPGETKSFEITTSVPSADLGGYELMVERVEL